MAVMTGGSTAEEGGWVIASVVVVMGRCGMCRQRWVVEKIQASRCKVYRDTL